MTRALGFLVPLLFFCSGATALVYEVVWSKYLGLIFGSTAQAQTTVLAVFMGGLALGNNVFGKKADQQRTPLAVYGIMEVALGLWAFFFPHLYRAGDALFVSIGAPFLDSTGVLLIIKGFVSLLLLLLPTILMGGTLPMVAAWLSGTTPDAGRLTARFYAVNTVGAVTGAAVAGFYLVKNLGLPTALQVTALTNIIIGFIAIGLGRQNPVATAPKPSEAPQSAGRAGSVLDWRIGAIVAATGAISMALQALASRALALLVGGSLYAFAIVLIAFILGIGIGGSVVASARIAVRTNAVWYLFVGAGVYVSLFILGLEKWIIFYSQAKLGLAPNHTGYLFHQMLVGLVAIIALGIPAALLGAVLPLCLRQNIARGEKPGEQVGKLLTWNAFGAVGGALAAGFVIMPLIGLRGSLSLCALAAICAGGLFAWSRQEKPLLRASVVIGALVLATASFGGEGWRHVLGSGVFRLRNSAVTQELLNARRQSTQLLFYKDAPDATVAVETTKRQDGRPETVLKVNGKADASSSGDLATQLMVGYLPLLARPAATDVFVLGLGSGITAGGLLPHPTITNIVIAENCKPIISASEHFRPWNRDVLNDPRTRLYMEDARTVLKLSPQNYDVIICEPSNPWTAGIGSVFSKEFYELATTRLKEGGVVAQWFHIYEMHDGIVFLVLRTFSSVFPYFEVWEPQGGDIVLLGSHQPININLENARLLARSPGVASDLESIGLGKPEAVFARQLASQRTAWAIPGAGGIQEDDFPVLEYIAPEAFFIGRPAAEIFSYDERTTQLQLATREKAEALQSLTPQEAWNSFLRTPSDNVTIMEYLRWRVKHAADPDAAGGYPNPMVATIFRSPSDYPKQAPVIPGATAEQAALASAEAAILSGTGEPTAAAAQIESALTTLARMPTGGGPQVAAGRYAALASRIYFVEGQLAEAARVIAIGEKLEPGSPLLAYMERLIRARAEQSAN